MRKLIIFSFIACFLIGVIVWQTYWDDVSGVFKQYVENGDLLTIKSKYTPEEIMELHKKELIINERHKFLKPEIKLHPYVLLDIKYLQDNKSREGYSLWSLIDGELVSNTENWEQSHGFEDALNVLATRQDFILMHAIAKQKNSSLDQLQKDLHVQKETLINWIASAVSKQLIIQKGNDLKLHFQDPKILMSPETKLTNLLVKKPSNQVERISPKYSANQVIKNAKNAFGEEFTVRHVSDVYLPVYSISVINPDKSTFTTYWNGVTGTQIDSRYSMKGLY